jgi:branched-chain amino acid transport system substrate-binding protein
VLVRDSAGEPARAAAAVRELASHDDVIAIVGPLLSAECEAAAREAEDQGVPLLTLTSRQEIPLERPNVMRLRTTPDDEVHYLVNYAVTELGATRFAVLYPKDAYGLGMRDRYWQAVESLGGQVVGASSYEVADVDFAEPIREMIGYVLLTPAEHRALRQRKKLLERGRRLEPHVAAVVRKVAYAILGPEGEPLPPRVDFDVLFIPDAHDKVVLIAPQLAFHDLDHVQLLGSSGWNHPDLVRIARGHVRGAVVATSFHVDSPFPFVSRFVERYVATFGSQPDSYSAHGFDATELVLLQLEEGRDSRKQVLEGVLRVNGYPGPSGVFSFVEDGNARKRPFLLRVRGGRLIPLDSLN